MTLNFPLLSAREALRRFPLQLRLFVCALLALVVLAPTWHVCALSGHAHHGASHEIHGAALGERANAERTPAICVCAPPSAAPSDALSSVPAAHDNGFCLALLLQAMPHILAVAPHFSRLEIPVLVRSFAPRFVLNSRFFALYNGRAPPVFR